MVEIKSDRTCVSSARITTPVGNAPEHSSRLTSESENVLTSPPGWDNRFWGSKSPCVCRIGDDDDVESDAIVGR
jgi:hypothetical protein